MVLPWAGWIGRSKVHLESEVKVLSHLIRKEILDHISSLRFLILTSIGAFLIWISLYSGCQYYKERLNDFRLAEAATEERVRQMMNADKMVPYPTNGWQEIGTPYYLIHKSPSVMSIFVRGMDPVLGRSASGNWNGARLKLSVGQ